MGGGGETVRGAESGGGFLERGLEGLLLEKNISVLISK